MKTRLFGIALGTLIASQAFAFEDTKVMPRGVRRVTIRSLTTSFDEKTDGNGVALSLAKPLEKPLTFNDIVKNEKDPIKKQMTGGFLMYENVERSESVGTYQGDLRGKVNVIAPIVTYGLTDRITLAAAMPIYNMAMSPAVSFRANPTGQRFLQLLAAPYNNQIASSREAGSKINDAVLNLNNKLADNGYRRLQDWQATGPGDLQILSKIRVVDEGAFKTAITGGVVAPTGRMDDPDNLIDKGFGDGQWDLLGTIAFDQPLGETGLFINEFARYTAQLPGQKTMRMITDDETIEVSKEQVRYKLGDKIEAGTSLQYESQVGLSGGVGYNFYRKMGDIYKAGESSHNLSAATAEMSHVAELEVGYSSVPAFRRKETAIPYEMKFNYKHQLASRNMPVTHFLQLDAGVFF